MRNVSLMMEGVQFHPESFLTECGHQILNNFIKMFAENRKVNA
jgi:anthranilate synthase, component II